MTKLIRKSDGTRETLVLLTGDACVTIEVTIRGLELDASTLEKLLHAPLALIAEKVS